MPRGDRRGPAGFGPMTGRGAGFCAGYSVPGYMNPVGGRGFAGRGFGGRGRGFGFYGRGRGFRHQFYGTGMPYWAGEAYQYRPTPDYYEGLSPESEVDALSREAEFLKQELGAIEDRLSQLENVEKQNPTDKR